MKNVLVTGGAGFIGSELTKLLLEKNCRVTVFDNLSFGKRKNVWKGVRFIRGDLRRERDVKKIQGEPFDAVFHMAALHFIPYCNQHPKETLQVNLEGTQTLLDIISKAPPGRFFFASTAAVYGPSNRPHTEKETPQPMDIYGISKLAGEHLVRLFAHTHRICATIGRLFNAYGPRETNPHLIPSLIEQIQKNSKTISLGNLKPYRDYIHTRDVANAIYLLCNSRPKKTVTTVNIGSGKEYSVNQVVAILQKAADQKLRIQTKSNLVRKVERMHLVSDISLLKNLTGFSPQVPFSEGISALLVGR